MGDIFAYLLLFGLILQPGIFIGSIVLVYYLARRTTVADTGRKRVSIAIIAHIVLITGTGLLVELLRVRWEGSPFQPWLYTLGETAPLTVVPLLLFLKYRSLKCSGAISLKPTTPGVTTILPRTNYGETIQDAPVKSMTDPGELRTAKMVAWTIGLTGICVPWLSGLAVKMYLQSMGHPTWPLSEFFQPSVFFLILGSTLLLWSSPCLVLALLVRYRTASRNGGRSFRDRLWLAGVTYLVGMGTALLIFPGVFWDFDILYLFIPIGFFIAGPMLLGYGAGLVALRYRKAHDSGSHAEI